MVDYPLSLPTDALMTLLDVVRGKIDASKAVHAAWNLLGYGLAQGFPLQQGIGDSSDDATAEAIEALLASQSPQEAIGFPSLAFSIVLKLAMKIILDSLSWSTPPVVARSPGFATRGAFFLEFLNSPLLLSRLQDSMRAWKTIRFSSLQESQKMKSHFSTRNAAGKNFNVTFAPIGNEEWAVTITDAETLAQDHGIFKKLEDGLFGIEGLMDDEFGFATDDIVMIQNEIALDLKNHGELVFQESAWLTITEAATRLGIDPSRVRLLVRQGRIPARRFGRAWVISEADLNTYQPRPQGKPGHTPKT